MEDEPLTRMTIAEHLRDTGFRVLEAANADEARAYFLADEPIAILLTDIHLPGRNGLVLAEWALKEAPDLKVVFLSGHPDHRDAAQKIGVFLSKPLPIEALPAFMRGILGAPAS